jgi:hypothetical protein
MHEKVVQIPDVPGEESHGAIPYVSGTQPRFSDERADMFDCGYSR